jgi:predicted nucleic acid-binding protein
MKLVIDANSIIAALLKDSMARAIIVGGALELVSPDNIKNSIAKHEAYITAKAGITKEELDLLVPLLFKNIKVIPHSDYKNKIKQAEGIMIDDPEDVPYVACYLALNCDGIWTNDNHYSNNPMIKVFKTKEVMTFL